MRLVVRVLYNGEEEVKPSEMDQLECPDFAVKLCVVP